MARPRTKAPETQIYFTTHWSGAFPELRLRTVVRVERLADELDLRLEGLRKHLWPAQLGRTEPSHHEEACPDTVWTAAGETEGSVDRRGAARVRPTTPREDDLPPHDYK